MIVSRGDNSKLIKTVFEEPEESIVTTLKELEEILCKVADRVSPINAKISLNLIKDTHFGVISV